MSAISSTSPVIPATPTPASKTPAKLKFNGSDKFIRELRKRVDAYFEQTGKRRRDVPAMYFKTATVLAWFFGAYFVLLFAVTSWYFVVPMAILIGLAVAAIGFNIQHDGGHKAYSEKKWVNKLMAMSLDLMGGSSYMWDWKHNSIHHTYTNIAGHDDDIDVGMLGRLNPHAPRYWFHRAQGIYLWVLYGLLTIKWHMWDDFYNVAVGNIGGHKIKRPKGADLAVFIGGKVVFFSLALIIPMLLGHVWWHVLGVYALAAFTSGVVLSVVFQCAHVVEEAQFPSTIDLPPDAKQVENEWAIHQVETTVNFARRNKVLNWFLGGLNYQVEHHLFSRICHVHYPELSKVVEQTCKDFGIKYNEHKTFIAAIGSHYRQLVAMGRADPI